MTAGPVFGRKRFHRARFNAGQGEPGRLSVSVVRDALRTDLRLRLDPDSCVPRGADGFTAPSMTLPDHDCRARRECRTFFSAQAVRQGLWQATACHDLKSKSFGRQFRRMKNSLTIKIVKTRHVLQV